ncbi:hypothetical protein Tco_1181801 [Tanacetum coccineum]
MGLWYLKDSGFELTVFSDADHAGCLYTRKSTYRGIQFLVKSKSLGCQRNKTALQCLQQKTEYQLADRFTKALSQDRFEYLVRRLGMRCLTPAQLEVLANETA